jgi:CO/xanthine dehydrogenase FAD-binding subunit
MKPVDYVRARIDEATRLKAANPAAKFLGGGTA